MIGKLLNYNAARGYGFLRHEDGTRNATFAHVYQLRKAVDNIRDGDRFEFDIIDLNGRTAATNLRLIN